MTLTLKPVVVLLPEVREWLIDTLVTFNNTDLDSFDIRDLYERNHSIALDGHVGLHQYADDELLNEWAYQVDGRDDTFVAEDEEMPNPHDDYEGFATWLTIKLVQKRLLGETLCPTS